jgi:hypothetical protein
LISRCPLVNLGARIKQETEGTNCYWNALKK